MHKTTVAAFALLAAGTAYAHARLAERPERQVGTLTCAPRTDAGLILGLSLGADCTYVSDRGDVRQAYAAILALAGSAPAPAVPDTLSWRVMTRGGTTLPGLPDGPIAVAGRAGRIAGIPDFTGAGVRLRLVSQSGLPAQAFVRAHPRIALARIDPATRPDAR